MDNLTHFFLQITPLNINKELHIHNSEKPDMPPSEAEQPVNSIVPLPLSTIPGRT